MTLKILFSAVMLTLAWAPLMAQTQLVAPNEVCLFDGKHYVSSDKLCFRVEPGMRHKLVPALSQHDFNDRASSIRVGADVEAWLFEHRDFAGKSYKHGQDTPSLERLYNEGSALMVVPKGRPHAGEGVTLARFREADIISESKIWRQFFPLPENAGETKAAYSLISDSDVDGKAKYVSLSSGVEVFLYPARDLDGDPVKLPGAQVQTRKPKYRRGPYTHTYTPDKPSGKVAYALDDFGFASKVLPSGVFADLPAVRSLQVRLHGGYRQLDLMEVLLCKHREFVDPCHSFKIEPGARHDLAMKLEDFGLAGAKSIAVGADVEAWLFGGKWFDAPRSEVTTNDGQLEIKPVSLVVHPHRGGNAEGIFLDRTFFPAPESENQWSSRELWDLNDKIDQVKLCGPISVTLYEHVDFEGQQPITLPGFGEPAPFAGECHTFNLDTWGFKNKASSYKASMQSQPAHPGAYKITLKTGDVTDAGTDAGVWVTLIGDQAEPQEFRLDTTQNDRERGQTDAYWVSGHPVGLLQAIRVRHDNRNDGPGWFLEEVRVQELASLGEWIFKTDTWLSKDRPAGIDETFTGPDYRPKIHRAQVVDTGVILGHAQAKEQQRLTDMLLAKDGVYNGINFPGRDLTKGKPILLAEPSTYQQCAQKCEANTACKSFTYVRPRPDRSAECWLKKAVPSEAEWVKNPSCVSGVRKTLQMQVVQPQVPPVPPASGSTLDTTVGLPLPSQLAQSFEGGFEYQTNRPGGRYKELLFDVDDPVLCAEACLDDVPTCKAFTYFKTGSPKMPAGKSYCSLKNIVPPTDTGQPCCISGVVSAAFVANASAGPAFLTTEKASTMTVATEEQPPTPPVATITQVTGSGFLDNTDFPGRDLPNQPIVYTSNATPERCYKDCVKNTDCAAFTFVKPDSQGHALCWLKWPVADESQRVQTPNPHTVSGLTAATGQQPPAAPPAAAPISPPTQPVTPVGTGGLFANFDTGLDSQWLVLEENISVQNGMLTCDDFAGAMWKVPPTATFSLDFKYRHGFGTGVVVLHFDNAQRLYHYRVWFQDDRVQFVRRSGTPELPVVAESDMSQPLMLVPGQLYAITITANAGQFHVAIDGQPRLTYTDPQPLPAGAVVFGCGVGQGFAFDDITMN